MRRPLRDLGNPEFSLMRSVFNLAGESGEDPERVARELREQEERSRAALEYQARMQRTFEKCPGFVGCDAPVGPGRAGKVTVEPARLTEAVLWLKRRVRVSERLDLSADNAVCLEVASKNAPSTSGVRPRKVTFGRPQQFELSL